MSSEKNRSDNSGTDPRVLRAVAHPLRLRLLHLLLRDGPLTASRCAERLDVTAKVCSYHLNLLGKYGLVEETGEGKGRARPWRHVRAGLSYVHRAGEAEETASAADVFAKTMLAHDASVIDAYIDKRRDLPEHWRNVAAMSSNPLRLSADQLRAFGADLLAVLDRYRSLSEPPAADSHPVHVAMYAVPTELAGLVKPPSGTADTRHSSTT